MGRTPQVQHIKGVPKTLSKEVNILIQFFFLFFFFFCLFAFSRAAHAAYGGSQARGLIGTIAASLHHSHSNARSLTH